MPSNSKPRSVKRIITILFLLIMSVATFGQETESSPLLTKQDYLKKSKNQKTGAWILAGGGFVLTTVGSVMLLNDATEEIVGIFDPEVSDGGGDAGAAVIITGLAAIGGSIPLFIAAGRNKRKATELSLNNQHVPCIHGPGFVYRSIPSLSLKIGL